MTISARHTGGFCIGTGKRSHTARILFIDWLLMHFCYIFVCKTRLGVRRFYFYRLITMQISPKSNKIMVRRICNVADLVARGWFYCLLLTTFIGKNHFIFPFRLTYFMNLTKKKVFLRTQIEIVRLRIQYSNQLFVRNRYQTCFCVC